MRPLPAPNFLLRLRGRVSFSRALASLTRFLRPCGMDDVTLSSSVRSDKPAGAHLGSVGSACLLLIATFLTYLPALRGGLLWDDDAHVTKPALRSLHGLARIWFELGATQQYYPVLHSAFWIEHRLWADSVLGYHLVNVVLHATAAWLLVLVLRRLAFPRPWLAGLLFALHPVSVESVAWIAEQKNTLSAVFYLGAALAYLGFDETRRLRPYFLASGLFLLALLTKSVTATLPAALLVVFWWRRGRIEWRRDVRPLLPWFAIGIASGLFTAWVERTFIGAQGADFSFTLLQRFLLAGRVIVFYLGKLVWPADLVFIYPRWSVDTGAAWQYLYDLGVLVLLGALIVRARKQRGPLAGFLFFVGTLFPVLGFVNVYPFLFSFVADHFQYLASLGVIVPATWALGRLAERMPAGGRGGLLLALPAALGLLAWKQCHIYRDAETLYRVTLARNPDAWLAHYNLAVLLGNSGRTAEAISEYKAALKLNPDHWAAHSNLASAYLREGRPAAAIAEYEAALRLNPDFAEAHNDLAVVLGGVPGRLPEAISHLRAALRLRPDFDGAHNNLGSLLMREPGKLDEAIREFRAALRLAPDDPKYHYNLANALAAAPGRLTEAVAEYRAALRLKPDYAEAHSNLGVAWAHLPGHLSDAISEYQAALRLAPKNAQIHADLANALAKIPERTEDAIAEYGAALSIDPDDAATHVALGIVLLKLPDRLSEATAEFETAVRLKPDFVQAHYCLGAVLLQAGKRKEAVDQFRQTLQLQPDFEPARMMLKRLE